MHRLQPPPGTPARLPVRQGAELEPRRLYTAQEIEEATGVTAGTIRADVSKGRWPAPDDTSERAHRWRGSTVTKAIAGRRGYRRGTNPPA